jgi:hypothetical protein
LSFGYINGVNFGNSEQGLILGILKERLTGQAREQRNGIGEFLSF